MTPGQAVCSSSSVVKRNCREKVLFLSKSLYPLWFFSCFAGLPVLTGVATDNALETFLLLLFSSFLLLFFPPPFKICLCPSHHCLTSYCQNLHSTLGVRCIHFTFPFLWPFYKGHCNHSFEGQKGTYRSPHPTHKGPGFSSGNRQPFTRWGDTLLSRSSLWEHAHHRGPVSWWHLTVTEDVSLELEWLNLSPLRLALSSPVLFVFYLCLQLSLLQCGCLIGFWNVWWKQFSLQLLFSPPNGKQRAQ